MHLCPSYFCPVSYQGREVLSGVIVGFDQILAKQLGIAPGAWSGPTAERMLLTEIAVLAILVSSLYSGVFYEGLLVPADEQRYTTYEELHADRVEVLFVSSEEESTPAAGLPLGVRIFDPAVETAFWPHKAYILDEILAGKVLQGGHHHVWPQAYGFCPYPLHISHWFLEHPIQLVHERLTQHGVMGKLVRDAEHSAKLWWGVGRVERAWLATDWQWSLLASGWVASVGCAMAEALVARVRVSRVPIRILVQ